MSARPYQRLRVSHEGGVATLRLHNPSRRNAIGPQMVNELLYALEDAHADEAVRSIVITGDGDEAFCAGGDFSQMVSPGAGETLAPKGDYADLLLALSRAVKPTIARVNGHAMGGGLGIVAAAHFAIGARGAKLGTPEIDVGLFPMMIMAVLQRVMPARELTRMMLLGERLSADDAVRAGLLHEVVDKEELDAAVARITSAIAGKSPIALRLGLEAMAAQRDLELEAALPLLRDSLARCLATDDAREGLTAFLQKRKPVWQGR